MISNEELGARLLKPLTERNSNSVNGIKRNPGSLNESIASYIANPTGKGSAYVANRSVIKQGLNLTFIKLLREYRRHFYAVPYLYPNGDMLYLVKVPSEDYKNNKISYDVIFFIKYDANLRRQNRDIEVYSNCPSFVFTYAYVYNKKGLFFSKLRDKMPSEALNTPPEVRNPIQSLGFEKSTYIAARYLVDGHCLSDDYVARFKKMLSATEEQKLFSQVADPDVILAVYQHAKYQQAKNHRKQLSKNEQNKRDKRNRDFAKEQKKNRPNAGGFIFHHSPQSKITARKAKRSLLNDKKGKK